jgi:DNA-binding response OmpR family regulator
MSKCVLIFEDDQDILEVIKTILEPQFNVQTRSTTEDIFLAVKDTNPDIILMDLRIPDIGGSDATLLLKSNARTHNIPILLLSANPNIEVIAGKTGADGFIKKPFDIRKLVETIESHLTMRGEAISASAADTTDTPPGGRAPVE